MIELKYENTPTFFSNVKHVKYEIICHLFKIYKCNIDNIFYVYIEIMIKIVKLI